MGLEDVIGEWTALEDKGEYYTGLCPIHFDTYGTPSLVVLKAKQYYYCTACKANGRTENFRQRMGIDTVCSGDDLRLYRLNALITSIYLIYMHGPDGDDARRYMVGRTWDESSGDLGYAPRGWEYVMEAIIARGFTIKDLFDAKLVRGDERLAEWVFANRIMFPIRNEEGLIAGFSGRTIGDIAGTIKYLNTAESPVFSKERILYNLDRAYSNIRSTGKVVIMEGFMDVLMGKQAGLKNVVGIMGVNLTKHQVRLLMKARALDVEVCLDNDAAGNPAMDRALEMLRPFRSVKKVILPVGIKDPGVFFEKGHTLDAFNALTRV